MALDSSGPGYTRSAALGSAKMPRGVFPPVWREHRRKVVGSQQRSVTVSETVRPGCVRTAIHWVTRGQSGTSLGLGDAWICEDEWGRALSEEKSNEAATGGGAPEARGNKCTSIPDTCGLRMAPLQPRCASVTLHKRDSNAKRYFSVKRRERGKPTAVSRESSRDGADLCHTTRDIAAHLYCWRKALSAAIIRRFLPFYLLTGMHNPQKIRQQLTSRWEERGKANAQRGKVGVGIERGPCCSSALPWRFAGVTSRRNDTFGETAHNRVN